MAVLLSRAAIAIAYLRCLLVVAAGLGKSAGHSNASESAVQGNIYLLSPAFFPPQFEANAKWDAWNAVKGKATAAAKEVRHALLLLLLLPLAQC
jgi:hypothetical protein